MKILGIIQDSISKSKKSYCDYITVSVDYDNGNSGIAMITRAKYDRIILQNQMANKYDIPQDILDSFVDKCFDEERAEHIWDKSD